MNLDLTLMPYAKNNLNLTNELKTKQNKRNNHKTFKGEHRRNFS